MTDFAILGVTVAVVSGLCLAAYHFWKHRKWERSLLLFFLPVLAYFLWHFSVEAYNWGGLWAKAQSLSNSGEITLEMDIMVALIDLKLLLTVFLLLFWLHLWKSFGETAGRRK